MAASPTIHLTAAPLPGHVDLFFCDGCEEIQPGKPTCETTFHAGYKYSKRWTERLCGFCTAEKFGEVA